MAEVNLEVSDNEIHVTPLFLEKRWFLNKRKLNQIIQGKIADREHILKAVSEIHDLLCLTISYIAAYKDVILVKYPTALRTIEREIKASGTEQDQADVQGAMKLYSYLKIRDLLQPASVKKMKNLENSIQFDGIDEKNMISLAELKSFCDIRKSESLKNQKNIIKSFFNKLKHSAKVMTPILYLGKYLSSNLWKVKKMVAEKEECKSVIEQYIEEAKALELKLLEMVAAITEHSMGEISVFIDSQMLVKNARDPDDRRESDSFYWEPFIYEAKAPNSLGVEELQLCCIVRAHPDSVEQDEMKELKVSFISQMDIDFPLEEGERLASPIVSITVASKEPLQFKTAFPARLALPSHLPKNSGRTLTMKMKKDDRDWRVSAASKAKGLQYKKYDLHEYLMDKEMTTLMAALVAVFPVDEETITEKGGKIISSVNKKVSVEIPPGSTQFPTLMKIKVEKVDQQNVEDMKYTEPHTGLMATSPLVSTQSHNILLNPILNLPLPPRRKKNSTEKENNPGIPNPLDFDSQDLGNGQITTSEQEMDGQNPPPLLGLPTTPESHPEPLCLERNESRNTLSQASELPKQFCNKPPELSLTTPESHPEPLCLERNESRNTLSQASELPKQECNKLPELSVTTSASQLEPLCLERGESRNTPPQASEPPKQECNKLPELSVTTPESHLESWFLERGDSRKTLSQASELPEQECNNPPGPESVSMTTSYLEHERSDTRKTLSGQSELMQADDPSQSQAASTPAAQLDPLLPGSDSRNTPPSLSELGKNLNPPSLSESVMSFASVSTIPLETSATSDPRINLTPQPQTEHSLEQGSATACMATQEAHTFWGQPDGSTESGNTATRERASSMSMGSGTHIIIALKRAAHQWKIGNTGTENLVGNVVSYKLDEISDTIKLIALEFEGDYPKDEEVKRMAEKIEKGQNQAIARLLVAQKPQDMNMVHIQICRSKDIQNMMPNLLNHDFTEIVPPCRELVLNEGQKIVFTCTGNIEMAEPSLPLVFNSFVASARIVLYVHVKDPMEQQLHKYYRGILHFTTQIDNKRLDDIPLSLPKIEMPENPDTGALLEKLFNFVSEQAEGKLFDALTNHWQIPVDRLQDINRAPTIEQKMKQLLYHWFVNSLQRVDKVKELMDAMRNIGREDMEAVMQAKKEEHDDTRKWHRVFICLLESSELLKKWKFIARELDITEAEIEFLENKYRDNIKEQAFQMMLKWKEKKGKRATRRVFVDALENQSLTTCAENFEQWMENE